MELFVNANTQTLAICSEDYVLILVDSSNFEEQNANHHSQHPSTSTSGQKHSLSHLSVVQFLPRQNVPLENFKKIHKDVYGCLGLISLKGVTYVGFVSCFDPTGEVLPHQGICRLTSTVFVNFSGEVFTVANQMQNQYQYDDYNDSVESSSSTSRINSVMKLLETGTFYYSYETDLSTKIQEMDLEKYDNFSGFYTNVQSLEDDYAGRFVWNGNLISELSKFRGRLAPEEKSAFDKGHFYITLIRGFAKCEIIGDGNDATRVSIISRQDCRKIGPLFGPSCMDEEGNVANFVETEVIIYHKKILTSYVIVKGNVPLFWKLDSHLLSTKIEFPRSEAASKHAFTRFFETMCSEYNMVYVIEALSGKGNQPELSERYYSALKELLDDNTELAVGYKKLYVNPTVGSKFKTKADYITSMLNDEQFCFALKNYCANQFDFSQRRRLSRQLGTFIINTLDSNDRSNMIESKISEALLQDILGNTIEPNVWRIHGILWNYNGAALGKLSDLYNTSIKTKNKTGGLIGKFAEQSKKYAEQSKHYVSYGSTSANYSHTGKQHQFDRLLGRRNREVQVILLDPIHDYFLSNLERRRKEFTKVKDLRIYSVTFNVNAILYDGDLHDLLFPDIDNFSEYDLISIALEEVIELTPSKVMSIDAKTRSFWETKIKKTLDEQHERGYTLLRSEQLGGVLLLVYASTKIIDNIKDVETSIKKTGFKGISANKGAAAITFTFSRHSRLCFVASHLAAGQSNADERHNNYRTIANGLTFKKCKSIKDSDIIIWMGDLNYRINSSNEYVRTKLRCGKSVFPNRSSESLVSNETESSVLLADSRDELDNLSLTKIKTHDRSHNKEETNRSFEDRNWSSDKSSSGSKIELVVEDENGIKLSDQKISNYEEELSRKNLKDVKNMSNSASKQNSKIIQRSTSSGSIDKIDYCSEKNNLFYNINETESQLSLSELTKVLSELFEMDQLNMQMKSGQSFPYFDEMEIRFKPTYKFDKGTDNYDTSEKQRVPSWTDRILIYVKNKTATPMQQLAYNSIPQFKFSDHKPVYGMFVAQLEIIDDQSKLRIENELYKKTKQDFYANETSNDSTYSLSFIARVIYNYRQGKALENKLPAPSSKTSRWWISKETDIGNKDGKASRVKIEFDELDSGEFMINPLLPKNPFIKTDIPMFVQRNDEK